MFLSGVEGKECYFEHPMIQPCKTCSETVLFFLNSRCSDTISSEHARRAIEKAQIGSTGRQLVRNVSNALVCLTR